MRPIQYIFSGHNLPSFHPPHLSLFYFFLSLLFSFSVHSHFVKLNSSYLVFSCFFLFTFSCFLHSLSRSLFLFLSPPLSPPSSTICLSVSSLFLILSQSLSLSLSLLCVFLFFFLLLVFLAKILLS